MPDPGPEPVLTSGRIDGVDLARALAMAGMVIAHFVERTEEPGVLRGGVLDAARAFVDGRAMPLFVLLAGVSVALLVRRSARPDRGLLVRALLFLPLGLLLQAWTRDIAIVLQYYALFFVVAVGLRRLSDRVLLAVAALAVAAGGWTYQVWGDLAPGDGRWEGWVTVREPWRVLVALTIDGYYPLLPSLAFLAVGLWVGRRVIARRSAVLLTGVGAGLAVLGYLGGRALAALTGADASFVGPGSFRPRFSWLRLLDTAGHSQMPAWVIGSTGCALVAVGVCVLVAAHAGKAARAMLRPFVLAGRGALTFYVLQALVIRWTPEVATTAIVTEYLIAAAIFGGFVVVAVLWQRRFRRPPLEALLHRVGGTRPAHAV